MEIDAEIKLQHDALNGLKSTFVGSDIDQICKSFQDFYETTIKAAVPSINPTIYIMYGPPASGKGHILKTLSDDAIRNRNYVNVNLDDIIQSNTGYIRDIEKIKCKDLYNVTNCEIINKDNIEKCKSVYFRYKPFADCYSTLLLLNAIKQHKNIVYETTGRSVRWFLDHDLKFIKPNYKIVIIYPLVDIDKLKERSCARAKEHGRYVDEKTIKEIVSLAPTNLISILNEVKTYDLRLYDNNGTDPILLFEKTPSLTRELSRATKSLSTLEYITEKNWWN